MTTVPEVVVAPDETESARTAARWLYEQVCALAADGRRVRLALSGGKTPWAMLRVFVALDPPWQKLDLFQVDERFVPTTDPRSNAGQIAHILPAEAHFHPIPTDTAPTPEAAAREYENTLAQRLGSSSAGEQASLVSGFLGETGADPLFDIVHLGLGEDGHTASLVPGDSILTVRDRAVAATEKPYQGVRRVSLTYRALLRSGRLLWLVTGPNKKAILRRFLQGDPDLPAHRLLRAHDRLFTDRTTWGD